MAFFFSISFCPQKDILFAIGDTRITCDFINRLRSWKLQRNWPLNGFHLCLLSATRYTRLRMLLDQHRAHSTQRCKMKKQKKKKKRKSFVAPAANSASAQCSALTRYRVRNHVGRTSVFNQFTYGNVLERARAQPSSPSWHLYTNVCPTLGEQAWMRAFATGNRIDYYYYFASRAKELAHVFFFVCSFVRSFVQHFFFSFSVFSLRKIDSILESRCRMDACAGGDDDDVVVIASPKLDRLPSERK